MSLIVDAFDLSTRIAAALVDASRASSNTVDMWPTTVSRQSSWAGVGGSEILRAEAAVIGRLRRDGGGADLSV
ncbi:MAG: hypothetical protein M3285_02055 [Actinomycetota bacterium]|nr:hypothetical protein [Actinomycetota bacterium]